MPQNKSTIERNFRKLAAAGALENLKKIIKSYHSIDVNAQGPLSGRTALHQAAVRGHHTVVMFLLQNGALKSIKDKAGFTALEYTVNPIIKYSGPMPPECVAKRQKQLQSINKSLESYQIKIHLANSITDIEKTIEC